MQDRNDDGGAVVMVQVRSLVEDAAARLSDAGVDSPVADAEWLAADCFGCTRSTLPMHKDKQPEPKQVANFEALVQRRVAREPLTYILGTARFRTLTLEVGPGALVPRPETELLAERALIIASESAVHQRRPTVIDVGTGTGAVALSIAAEGPAARVYATEASAAARGWALRNMARTSLGVTLLPGELLRPLHPSLGSNCDLIVANLPYLSEEEWLNAPPEVRKFEPKEALVGGPTGLELIVDLIEESEQWLSHAGSLLLEIGETQAEDVVNFMQARGFREVCVRKDLTGRDRIVEGRWTTLV